MQMSTVVVVIQSGKEGGDKIIGRVKEGESVGKIVFFKDLKEVKSNEFPDIGDEIEVYIINNFEKFMHCAFFEDIAYNLLLQKNQKKEHLSNKCVAETSNLKTKVNVFDKLEYSLTSIEDVNDFLADRVFALVETLVRNDEIIYIVRRQ